MGMRFRMKPNYDCSALSSEVQVICTALKRFGMFVADNGSNWYLSGSHDPRWNDDNLSDLGQIRGEIERACTQGPAQRAAWQQRKPVCAPA